MTDDNENTNDGCDIPHTEHQVRTWKDAIQIGSERPSSDSPYLNDSDINNLLGRSDSSDEFDQDAVAEALAGIEKRLIRLLYDIAALSYGGHLDDTDTIWTYLEESPDHMNLALRKAFERDTATNGDYCFDLGFNTGLAFSELTGMKTEDERGSKFLDGFIEAYSTEGFYEPYQRLTDTGDQTPHVDPLNPDRSPAQDGVFTDHNITSTRYMRRLIWNYKTALDNIETQSALSLVDATERFIENVTDDWFETCCTVRTRLDEEWETLADADVAGVDAETVLEAFWTVAYEQEQSAISSTTIRDAFGGKDSYAKSVTQVLNRLSETGKNPSSEAKTTFKHSAIVSYTNNWELTDYGRLLSYYALEEDLDPQWIQEASLQMSLITDETDRWSDEEVQMLEAGVNEHLD